MLRQGSVRGYDERNNTERRNAFALRLVLSVSKHSACHVVSIGGANVSFTWQPMLPFVYYAIRYSPCASWNRFLHPVLARFPPDLASKGGVNDLSFWALARVKEG
jgi:hypothetical protein